jgi:hypothetical protein
MLLAQGVRSGAEDQPPIGTGQPWGARALAMMMPCINRVECFSDVAPARSWNSPLTRHLLRHLHPIPCSRTPAECQACSVAALTTQAGAKAP